MTANGQPNATVIQRIDVNPTLMIVRVKPDGPLFSFEPGQYTVLGLLGSVSRVDFSEPDEEAVPPDKLVCRAFSISSSSKQGEYVEFYVSLVRSGKLTPRLFQLEEGDRVWLGPKATGQFTLNDVSPDHDLLMVSTGTGLAPYISMIRSAHTCGKGQRFIVIHGACYSWDLGYRSELEALDHGCGTFLYIPTVTGTEKDRSWTGHVGRVHTVLEDGTLAARMGGNPDPTKLSVFLSGARGMVEDMQERFEAIGFTLHSKKRRGNIHVERYW